jgi:antitoxin component YwqK of YwqJK toxin-antitoxin module
MQCQAILKSGKQCSRNAQTGSNFCWQHQNYIIYSNLKDEKEEVKNIQTMQNVIIETFYPNKRIKERITYKDKNLKVLDGPYESWYQTGESKEKANYKNGKLNGLYEEWWEPSLGVRSKKVSTQLFIKRNYKDGKLNGLDEVWSENGQLLERANYKNNKKHGLYELWNQSGKLLQRNNYKNGELIS